MKLFLIPIYICCYVSFIFGESEIISKYIIQKYLPPNAIIVEAGAHNGGDTYEMATSWPQSSIYAFEPVPSLFNQLRQRCGQLKNVILYQCALGNENGRATLYVSSGASDGSSSLMKPTEHLTLHPTVTFPAQIQVNTITLDDWAKKEGIDHIDFLWLDMQGFELHMMKAAPQMMQTVRAIVTEISLLELYEGCPLYSEVREWLESQGFKVILEKIPWDSQGNVLFAR